MQPQPCANDDTNYHLTDIHLHHPKLTPINCNTLSYSWQSHTANQNILFYSRNQINAWCNGLRDLLKSGISGFDIGYINPKIKIGIGYFSALNSKSKKDWLARNQDNVSEWSDMSTTNCCSELALLQVLV